MSFDADEDILQDFLVEAGEILEQLSEQLVRLERTPDDLPLLNAIFRGFHTVKGGAGFLKLTALVETCHLGENIFDKLRNQELRADAQIMDLVLQVLDIVNSMFDEIRAGSQPTPADESFLDQLRAAAEGGGHAASKAAAPAPAPKPAAAPKPVAPAPPPSASVATDSSGLSDADYAYLLDGLPGDKPAAAVASDDITDDEFESLLDQLHGKGSTPAAKPAAPSAPAATGGDISDDEFEALLDQLHGKGQAPAPVAAVAPAAPAAKAGEDIGDDEFEALLDQLHGKGQAPGLIAGGAAPAASSAPAAPAETAPTSPAPTARAAAPAPRAESRGDGDEAGKAAGGNNPLAQAADTTVRVDTKRLDDIMNLVGELVLVRNRLLTLAANLGQEDLAKSVSNLDVVTSDLQGAVMQTRMQPIKKVFGRFPRVVRDLARSLKKEINLELVGEDTDLDKNMVEALADPLVHLVRNSVDHGIEMPEDRVASGKDRVGKVLLSAAQEGDHILLTIADDGKGMDPQMLRRKAVEKGLMEQEQADRLSDAEAFNLIFLPGFSTKTEVSDISGRGVGMDVVKTRIAQLNGSTNVISEVGKGTTFQIKLPLTLAILPTLMVQVHGQVFALPLASVNEIFHLDLTKTNVIDGQPTLVVRQKALPLFYLQEWLVRGSDRHLRRKEGFVVIVQMGSQRIGFVVDALIGQQEVVIKPLGKSLQGTPGMAGATITSDGGIALILDIPSLLKRYARKSGRGEDN